MAQKILLDVNVHKRFTGPNGQILIRRWIGSGKRFNLDLSGNFDLVVPPAAVLELSGVTAFVQPMMSLTPQQYAVAHTQRQLTALLGQLHVAAKNHFSAVPELQPSALAAALTREMSFASPEHAVFFTRLIIQVNDPIFHDLILESLSWDYTFKHQHLGPWANSMQMANMVSIYSLFQQGVNFSLARGVKQIWDELYRRLLIKHKREAWYFQRRYKRRGLSNSLFDAAVWIENAISRLKFSLGRYAPTMFQLNKAMELKRNRDFLDVDLMHLAVVGYITPQGAEPVLCFTTDDAWKVRNRLSVFKSILKYTEDLVHQLTNQHGLATPSRLNLANGAVYICCKRSGRIKTEVDVSSIRPFGG